MKQELLDLTEFLHDAGCEHFMGEEICPAGKHAHTNGPVLQVAPRQLWPHIITTLRVLEWLRMDVGAPIHVLSGYRDPAYNKAIGGETDSMHMQFNAIDFRHPEWEPETLAKKLLKHSRAAQCGIGLYERSGFVHLDTRGLIGRTSPARWSEDGKVWWK